MKEFKVNTVVYDWIFWISIGVIVAWMILKVVGVFHSPVWQEMLPIAGGVAAVIAYSQKTGRYLERIDHIDKNLTEFKLEMHDFRNKTETKFDEVRADLHKHDNRLIRIEAKLA